MRPFPRQDALIMHDNVWKQFKQTLQHLLILTQDVCSRLRYKCNICPWLFLMRSFPREDVTAVEKSLRKLYRSFYKKGPIHLLRFPKTQISLQAFYCQYFSILESAWSIFHFITLNCRSKENSLLCFCKPSIEIFGPKARKIQSRSKCLGRVHPHWDYVIKSILIAA